VSLCQLCLATERPRFALKNGSSKWGTRESAIHHQLDRVDVRGVVRREEEHGFGNLFRLAPTALRNRGREELLQLSGIFCGSRCAGPALPNGSFDRVWCDDVHANVARCKVGGDGTLHRSALLVALLETPHRFRTKRQLWAYSGFGLETHDSGEYRYVRGQLRRNRERVTVLGLNQNHNHDVKNIFKSAAISASIRPGPFQEFYAGLLAKGRRPAMARLTLARKIAAITLTIWKKGVCFDAKELHRQAA
jgi:hypothetical protein